VRTLVEYIDEQRPRLVVMGTRGLTGLRAFAAGSVSHGVAFHVRVPVLIVPPEDDITGRDERPCCPPSAGGRR
jgi:nucleotide-binding universal stress UspA family protein